jgi:hypothetical protein
LGIRKRVKTIKKGGEISKIFKNKIKKVNNFSGNSLGNNIFLLIYAQEN